MNKLAVYLLMIFTLLGSVTSVAAPVMASVHEDSAMSMQQDSSHQIANHMDHDASNGHKADCCQHQMSDNNCCQSAKHQCSTQGCECPVVVVLGIMSFSLPVTGQFQHTQPPEFVTPAIISSLDHLYRPPRVSLT
ncbi:hypothetical protein [Neptunicella marina]|uniref:CopL family metal-binding regulatory protein n=1 Tax=Neptunicella marina TaxID=2125989 RepID=A0A8J6IT89_9ALTE|nr:hypothetical protein [Neptunicella marina]MBC3765327.1 hypothetical protein [Neptunicella marina]